MYRSFFSSSLFSLLALTFVACASGGGDTRGRGDPDGGAAADPDGGEALDGAVSADATTPGEDGAAPGEDASRPVRCADLECDPRASCVLDMGAPTCVCPSGFEGDGFVCEDIDECAGPVNPCEPDACVNEPGGFSCDACPDDPAKTEPGVCGCGTPDTDTDGDGTPDCIDGCPLDPEKTEPGVCGCGEPDTDTDGDGTPDCIDGCPLDPEKIEPGVCGCGNPEPTPSTTTISDSSSTWSANRYFRSNVYQTTSATTLVSFEQYLGLTGTCTVDFYVLRGPSESGPWTQLWSDARSLPSGNRFVSSGPINVPLASGFHHALGVGWNCSATYHGSNAGWSGHSTPVGAFRSTAWDNSYPGLSGSYAPPNSGTGGTAYRQRITVGVCP